MTLTAADDVDVVSFDQDLRPAVGDGPASSTFDKHDERMVGASLALTLLRAIPDAAYVMDLDGRVTFINRAGLRHLHDFMERQHLDGRYLWELWPGAAQQALQDAAAEVGEGEEVNLSSVACPQEGGTTAICDVKLCPVDNADGNVSKILVLTRPGCEAF